MAAKKATPKPSKRTPAKKVTPKVESKPKTDKELVLEIFPEADVLKVKGKFCIIDADQEKQLHSGLADSESDAWKIAAHAVI